MPAAIPLVAVLAVGFASATVGGGIIGAVVVAGVAAGQAVLIGDHQTALRAAKAAGVPSIVVAWGYGTRKDADARPSSPSDLPALLV